MSGRSHCLLRLLLICLYGIGLLSIAFSTKHALAASDPITVTSETDTINFPKYIDFALSASDTSSPITQAYIYIALQGRPYAPSVKYQVAISNPAQTITLHYPVDTTGNNFLSPGTPIKYHWALEDKAGNWHIEATQNFTTIDTRFAWQGLSQGLLHVHWYNRSQGFGQLLLNKANASIQHISSVLGNGLQQPINVWVYASNEDFHGALAPGSYEWVGGEAEPWLNEAFISVEDSNDNTLVRDMPHELTHLVFHQLIAQGPSAPTWFDEGMAVYNQLYHEPEMKFRFEQALTNHSLLRLDSLAQNFPAESDKAYLAYAQSWQLLDYMYSTFGQPKMSLLIKHMHDPANNFNHDLTASIGEDQIHLENQWRLHLNQPPVLYTTGTMPTSNSAVKTLPSIPVDNTAPVLITTGILLIVFPLFGLVGMFVYQRRQRRAWVMQEAQQILAAQRFRGQERRHTGPIQAVPPVNTNGLPSQTYSSPTSAQTRDTVWQPTYPAPDERENAYSSPFIPFQENSGIQPKSGKSPPEA